MCCCAERSACACAQLAGPSQHWCITSNTTPLTDPPTLLTFMVGMRLCCAYSSLPTGPQGVWVGGEWRGVSVGAAPLSLQARPVASRTYARLSGAVFVPPTLFSSHRGAPLPLAALSSRTPRPPLPPAPAQVDQIHPEPSDLHARGLQVLALLRVGHDHSHVVCLLSLRVMWGVGAGGGAKGAAAGLSTCTCVCVCELGG